MFVCAGKTAKTTRTNPGWNKPEAKKIDTNYIHHDSIYTGGDYGRVNTPGNTAEQNLTRQGNKN